MLASPHSRSCRSEKFAIDINTRFIAGGLRNGRTPSSTRYSATAANKSDQLMPRRSAALGTLQVFEELAVGADHQHVVVSAERFVIGLQAPVERIELRVARIGARVGLGCAGIALAPDHLRLAIGLRLDLGLLAVRLGAQLLGVLVTLGAQLLRLPVEVLPHAAEHGF